MPLGAVIFVYTWALQVFAMRNVKCCDKGSTKRRASDGEGVGQGQGEPAEEVTVR